MPRLLQRQSVRCGIQSKIGSRPAWMCIDAGMEWTMPLPYEAFCRDRWSVYCQYATACVGSARLGASLADDALCDLAEVWAEALSSASPRALAWGLLTNRTRTWHASAARRLHELLQQGEANALFLRYRLGLLPQRAADVM